MKTPLKMAGGMLALAASTVIAATIALFVLVAMGLWSLGERALMLAAPKNKDMAR